MTSTGPIDYAVRDGAAWITMTEGDRGNPISLAWGAEMLAALRRARAEAVPVVVLRATGRFFSVGGDVSGFGGAEDLGALIDDLAEALHRIVSEITRLDAVVVCAVQGFAAGAAFPLAAAADIVVASESAKFTLGYTKIGLSTDGGSSLLVHTLGLHRTLRLALLNDVLTAPEALEAGLVARVFPDASLDAEVDRIVAGLVAGPAAAQVSVKRLLRDTVEPNPEQAMRRETLAMRRNAALPDGREGVTAFLEKRAPSFG